MLDRLSHLSSWSFGLGSLIGFGYLSLGYLVLERGSGVKAIQSVSRRRQAFLGMGNDTILHRFHMTS